jgi:hypothetical protein
MTHIIVCRYVECHYAKGLGYLNVLLSVIVVNVVM